MTINLNTKQVEYVIAALKKSCPTDKSLEESILHKLEANLRDHKMVEEVLRESRR